VLIWTIPGLSVHPAFFADTATNTGAGSVLSHLALIQNLSPAWFYGIDPPMWSVAVEFQIYFLLPTLFLPIYRRWGVTAVVVFGYAMAVAISLLTHGQFDYSEPHFIGLFCMGMLAAKVTVGQGAEVARLRRLPWQLIAGVTFVAAFLLSISDGSRTPVSA